jgi:hypothetical protein
MLSGFSKRIEVDCKLVDRIHVVFEAIALLHDCVPRHPTITASRGSRFVGKQVYIASAAWRQRWDAAANFPRAYQVAVHQNTNPQSPGAVLINGWVERTAYLTHLQHSTRSWQAS